uniref:BCL-11A-like CCHC zinc finger domain-containing protein n=1 Tax=Branchiostoma floridae TaxID=7739 RepID=C3ZQB3_BRAFL|eukprot:XP_002589158.1 hypothetical protein BRAFLDRAFT_84948 [Branchiostoma floridae]
MAVIDRPFARHGDTVRKNKIPHRNHRGTACMHSQVSPQVHPGWSSAWANYDHVAKPCTPLRMCRVQSAAPAARAGQRLLDRGARPVSGGCKAQPDHDLLTCGECQTDFPLSDILLFIEHKKHCMTPTDGHLEERLDLDRSRNATEKRRAPTPISVGIQVGPSEDQPTPEQKAPGGHKTGD